MPSSDQPPLRERKASQRRHVTILFSDLSGSTALGAQLDPEDLAEVVQVLKTEADAAITSRGGVISQFQGDGVRAVFGHPTPYEDDVRRAVEAALAYHAAIAAYDFSDIVPPGHLIRMHSGVHSGLLFIGDTTITDGRYELIGEAANTAAGLCSAAEADEILVSAETIRGASAFFDTEIADPVALKGVEETVPAVRVIRRSGAETRFDASRKRGLTLFAGRGPELARIGSAWERALSGKLSVLAVTGAAGLGKTRLVEEFLGTVAPDEALILRGFCENYGETSPLQPFVQMLREALGITGQTEPHEIRAQVAQALAGLDPALSLQLPQLLDLLSVGSGGGSGVPPDQRSATALMNVIEALCRDRPLILAFDDWQWADDASRTMVSVLLRALRTNRVLVLAAARGLDPVDPIAGSADVIALEPFSPEDSSKAIAALLPDTQDWRYAERIHEHAGGNPLYIEELCLAPRAISDGDGSGAQAGKLPPTLYGLISNRVERLPEDQATLARVASVIGNVVPVWLLGKICGAVATSANLSALAEQDILYDGQVPGTKKFKHGVTREAIYEMISLRERRRLHREIGETLNGLTADGARDEHLESLAYHFSRANDYKNAAHFAELAGEKAMSRSSLDLAREHFRSSLTALDGLTAYEDIRARWIGISNKWAMPCVYSPAPEHLDIMERTVAYAEQTSDAQGLIQAIYWIGYLHYSMGNLDTALGHIERALDLAQQYGSPGMVAQVRNTLGQAYVAASDYDRGIACLDHAINAKRKNPSRTRLPVGTAYALASRSLAIGDRGEFEAAHEDVEEALESVRGAGHEIEGSCLGCKCTILLWQGRWAEAVATARQGREVGVRVSGPYIFTMTSAQVAYGTWMEHREDTALERLRMAAEWLDDNNTYLFASLAWGWLTDALERAGHDEDARIYATKTIERAAERDQMGCTMAWRVRMRLAARDALDMPVETCLKEAIASAETRGSAHDLAGTRLEHARILTASGQYDDACAIMTEVLPALRRMAMAWHMNEAATIMDTLDRGPLRSSGAG
ncbi:MAG: AAA family ATPase [Pseudomonadota bacterium]